MIGRDRELEQVGRLLAEDRVVALVGPSGVGKTLLARAFADSTRSVFLDCFGIAPGEIRARVVQAIEASGNTEPSLLVLDNWPNATEPRTRELFERQILITAHVPPPQTATLAITPFNVPPPDELEESAAYRVFMAATDRAMPGASERLDKNGVHDLIRTLGGHPLGIAIAARHAAVFGASEVARLLSEGVALEDPQRDARQRSRSARSSFHGDS